MAGEMVDRFLGFSAEFSELFGTFQGFASAETCPGRFSDSFPLVHTFLLEFLAPKKKS